MPRHKTKQDDELRIRFGVSLAPNVKEMLDKQAAELGINRSAYLTTLIMKAEKKAKKRA